MKSKQKWQVSFQAEGLWASVVFCPGWSISSGVKQTHYVEQTSTSSTGDMKHEQEINICCWKPEGWGCCYSSMTPTILTQTQCSGLSNNNFSFEQWDILDILFIGFEESSGWCFLWYIQAPRCYLSDLSSSPIALESSFQITLVLDDVFFLTLLFLTLFTL